MNNWQRSIAVLGLTVILAGSIPLSALAESMYVPRIGYHPAQAKRIYLDIHNGETEKLSKEERKAREKRREELEKKAGQQEEDDDVRVADSEETIDLRDTLDPQAQPEEEDEDGPGWFGRVLGKKSDEEKAREEAEKEAEKAEKEAEKAEKKALKELDEQERLKARIKRQKAIYEKIEKERAERERNKPVAGDYYLFDIKKGRLLYKEPATLNQAGQNAPTSYFIEFSELPLDGVYDVAVEGSGHRSETPIWVSEDIYWEALQRVMEGVGKAHCPQEKGVYYILQKCYAIKSHVQQPLYHETPETVLNVKGGWFLHAPDDPSIVKDTVENANLAKLLLNIYNISPHSYKYLTFDGRYYTSSTYPDILDEANWALQFMLSAQRPDGGFSKGLKKVVRPDGVAEYWLLPADNEATARAVMTLAGAVEAFRDQELSYSVKFLRAAEKGWNYLSQQENVNPEWLLLASASLSQVTNGMEYQEAYEQAKPQVNEISPETALYLGSLAKDLNVRSRQVDLGSTDPQATIPLIAELIKENPAAQQQMDQWVTNLFGYEKVPLIRDKALEVSPVWRAPLEWMAYETNKVAITLNRKLEEDNIIVSADVDPSLIEQVDRKERQARKRLDRGYRKLDLDVYDRIYLSYGLALLNQVAAEKPLPEEKRGSIFGTWGQDDPDDEPLFKGGDDKDK